ncbi:hypothetical protein GMD78_09480 [Ornithinibacillus sp. L9]|uniref:Uncharacterized protein n=1 Tax=Ornithinibacillus caprae TaxID=2678566 RepID=A0A6N8FGD1_9BACI|nr:hypothetical protein [Ornithinibacillus caprae]MUK88620.1 hypothetical protein [Ornithinibacillus caprae]
MGLFINKSDHPGVFQHKGDIEGQNQSYFKSDHFAELIQEQKKLNESLTKGIREIKIRHQQYEFTEAKKWNEMGKQLEELKKRTLQHEKFEHDAREWLQMLERNNKELQQLMANEVNVKQEIMDQIKNVSQSNHEIVNQLTQHESFSEQLTSQMDELYKLHQQMAEQITKQEEKQDQVLNSFENQEALMEKTIRQVDHIRAILFERTSHIVEQIENSYNLTSSLIYKFISGSEKPLTLMMRGKSREGKQKNDE